MIVVCVVGATGAATASRSPTSNLGAGTWRRECFNLPERVKFGVQRIARLALAYEDSTS